LPIFAAVVSSTFPETFSLPFRVGEGDVLHRYFHDVMRSQICATAVRATTTWRRRTATVRRAFIVSSISLHEGGDLGGQRRAQLHDGSAGADDVRAAAAGALRAAGRDTVNLYRDAAAERRAAAELFGGSSQLGRQLRLSRYCTRVLVGRLSTTRLSAEDGLVIAQAPNTSTLHGQLPAGGGMRPAAR
jgi:hypothetical protein